MLSLLACTPPEATDTSADSPPDTQHESADTADTSAAPTVLSFTATVPEGRPTEVLLDGALDLPATVRLTCGANEETHVAELTGGTSLAHAFYGLLPDTEYRCAVGVPGAGEIGSLVVQTGTIDGPPDWSVDGDTTAMEGTYTLFNTGPLCQVTTSQRVWIVDPEGRVRWSWTIPEASTGDIDFYWTGEDLVVGGGKGVPTRGDSSLRRMSLAQDVTLERRAGVSGQEYNHHTELLSTGEFLSIVWQTNTGDQGNFFGFGLERLDPATSTDSLAWNSQTAITAGTLPSGPAGSDWLHANSARWFADDPEGPSYWVSLAEQSQVIRIDADTGEITWKLGEGGDFRLYDRDGNEIGGLEWFEFQHAISMERRDDKVLLRLHDNGYTRGSSRALDLLVDPAARTATVDWAWTEPDWVERAGGDYDALPGGHRLLAQGHCACCATSGNRESTVTEVDPETGEVVWRLSLHGHDQWLYRAQRVDGCSLFANARYCPSLAE